LFYVREAAAIAYAGALVYLTLFGFSISRVTLLAIAELAIVIGFIVSLWSQRAFVRVLRRGSSSSPEERPANEKQ